jgi:hypothetical protein
MDQLPPEWLANGGTQVLDPLKELLQALPQVRKQLSDEMEMDDIIAALAAATGTDRFRYDGPVNAVDYLRGHMYT